METLDSVIADGPMDAPAYNLILSHIPEQKYTKEQWSEKWFREMIFKFRIRDFKFRIWGVWALPNYGDHFRF